MQVLELDVTHLFVQGDIINSLPISKNLTIKECLIFLGERHLTFSVHMLLHLKTDVLKNGHLWTHTCFPFEDYN